MIKEMFKVLREIPGSGWVRIVEFTLGLTFAITAIGVCTSVYAAQKFNGVVTDADILTTLILCAGLTIPTSTAMMVMIEKLRLANKKLHQFASTDGLTGILARNAFTDRVEHKLREAAHNNTHTPGSLFVIDVDNFKTINDRFGHQQGDTALILLSSAIARKLSRGDVFGRMGGEEFGVFVADVPPMQARGIAENIRRAVESIAFRPDGTACSLTISIGVSNASVQTRFHDLYRDADQKLYRAKADGRNRVEWRTEVQAKAAEESQSESMGLSAA